MNKNIEEFKRNKDILTDWSSIQLAFKALEDQEKRLKAIETELGIYTEEEIKNIKIGGTDPD